MDPAGTQPLSNAQPRSTFSHYLPRLRREFYQADAVIFWTMPIANRSTGWLNDRYHFTFREMMLHAAVREGLLCPAYCLMPDHIHFVWMGLRKESDQRNGVRFLREHLGRDLTPFEFQRQAYDHVLSERERTRSAFNVACSDYILLNPMKAQLVTCPEEWPYLGAVVPGYPVMNPFEAKFWERFWKIYYTSLEPGIKERKLPKREME